MLAVTTVELAAEVLLAAATVVAAAAVLATVPSIVRRPGAGRPAARRKHLTPALVILTGGAAVTFVAWLAFELRCGGACTGAREGPLGFEPWWRRHRSWQWSGQLVLASLGLATASLALTLSARRRKVARVPLIAARVAYGCWAVGVALAPAAYELLS